MRRHFTKESNQIEETFEWFSPFRTKQENYRAESALNYLLTNRLNNLNAHLEIINDWKVTKCFFLLSLLCTYCSYYVVFLFCPFFSAYLANFNSLACSAEEPPPRPPQPSLLFKSKCCPSVKFKHCSCSLCSLLAPPPQMYSTSVLYAFVFAHSLPLFLS